MVKVLIISITSLCYCAFLSFNFLYDHSYSSVFTTNVKYNQTKLQYIEGTYQPSLVACKDSNCPSKIYIPNDIYLKSHPDPFPLYSEASEDIFTDISSQKFGPTCIPSSFGYDPKYAEVIFPTLSYDRCGNEEANLIHIDHENHNLYMKCKSGEYYEGVKAQDELIGYTLFEEIPKKYSKSILLDENIEWAYGSCKESQYPAEAATYILKKNNSAFNHAKERMKAMQEEMITDYAAKTTTPLSVIMISVDSMSRKHFYRKMPITLEFLRSLDKEKHRVFDFKIHNIIGDNSIPNVYGVMTGSSYPFENNKKKHENAQIEDDLIKKEAIWTYLRSKGWVTFFGAEFCDDYFSYGIGRKPSVDHLSAKFWCAAEVLSGYEDKAEKQRCIGAYNSHFYMLNYTYQFLQEYEGVNKWAHIMILPAHEDSGTVISSLDEDLTKFLKKFLQRNDPTIIFLMADHGPRYGDWKKTFEGFQEHKLPMLFMIWPTDLLKKIPHSFDILDHNTNRLVTKFDLHMTLRHLSHIPYYTNFTINSRHNAAWHANKNEAYSLFLKKIPDDRTCESSKIDFLWCSCNNFKTIDIGKLNPYLIKLFNTFIKGIIDQINKESTANYKYYAWKICQKVTFKELLKAQVKIFNNYRQHFLLTLKVHESEDTIIESEIILILKRIPKKPDKRFYEFRNLYIGKKLQYRVGYIRHISGTDPICESIALSYGLYPGTCICKNLKEISYNTGIIIPFTYTYIVSELGENCQDACQKQQKTCSYLANENIDCDLLKSYAYCEKCSFSSNPITSGYQKNTCFATSRSSCISALNSFKKLCACI